MEEEGDDSYDDEVDSGSDIGRNNKDKDNDRFVVNREHLLNYESDDSSSDGEDQESSDDLDLAKGLSK